MRIRPPSLNLLTGSISIFWATTVLLLTVSSHHVQDPYEQTGASQSEVAELELNTPLERMLGPGETHVYRLRLTAGQYLQVVVEQRGIDVMLSLHGPDGQPVTEVDNESGTDGVEQISVVAAASEEHQFQIRARDKDASGRYQVRIAEWRAATRQDEVRVAAERSFAKGKQLSAQGTAESRKEAIEKVEAARSLFQAAGDQRGEAASLRELGHTYNRLGQLRQARESFRQELELRQAIGDRQEIAATLAIMGVVYRRLGQLQQALESYQQALEIVRDLGDRMGEALTLHNLGSAYWTMGEPLQALDYYNQALSLRRTIGDRHGEAATLASVGLVYRVLGDYQTALSFYGQALPLSRATGYRFAEVQTLHNLGAVYFQLGEFQRALEHYNQALSLRKAMGDRVGEASTLHNMAGVYGSLGEQKKALEYYRQSLSLSRATGNRRWEAASVAGLGLSSFRLGESQQALDYYGQALSLLRTMEDRYVEAVILQNMGLVYASLGQPERALDYYNQALKLDQAIEDRGSQANVLYSIARVERDRHHLNEAQIRIETALDLIESLRTKVGSEELRASYLASKQNYYELYVDLLMRMHQDDPSKGYAGAALHASERARARSLLEMLAEVHADIRQGVDVTLLECERRLQRQLNTKAQRVTQLLSGKHTEDRATAARKELETLLTQYRDVQAEIRVKSPRYAALTQPQPLNLKEIQQQVLDEDTLLLEYALSQERSFLWAVAKDSLQAYELPGRAKIEAAARRAYELLTASHRRGGRRSAELALAELSQMVLGPVADQLGEKRLLIVSDGALQYVPFAALPRPGIRDQGSGISKTAPASKGSPCPLSPVPCPLIVDHEIVSLPSASVLAVLRQELVRREPAAETVAVLADPVFSQSDERIKKPEISSPQSAIPEASDQLVRSGKALGIESFERLAFSRQEAEAIIRLTSKDENLAALDFAASREMATSPHLSRYRIVHFATHGLFNSQHPELSGIVLSLVDEAGQPRDGFLRLHEIYNLNLGAELVVLSACRTALGKEVKGEGLIGLTRGFMYAGAPRVVASLWDVRDEATAELMKRFYREMLKENQRPAAALRAAQVSLWKEPRWRAPYYWAGFILQGEWK